MKQSPSLSKTNTSVLIIALFGMMFTLPASREVTVTLKSSVKIDGTSNVTNFSCKCGETYPKLKFSFDPTSKKGNQLFQGALLKLKGEKLDCGNKLMNKDMYSTLNTAQHPYISLDVKEVTQADGLTIAHCTDWIPFEAKAIVTINGVSQSTVILLKGRNLGNSTFKFVGTWDFQLTDFKMTPPRRVMGMIKVGNDMRMNFDMEAQLLDPF